MPLNPLIRGGVDVPILDGGTGASTAAGARTNLSALDEMAHDLLNHTGLTGVGDLTTTTHASINHSVVPATFFNIGSATAAVANGDLAAGDGTREMFWDASTAILDFATTSTIRANGAGLDLTLGARGATYNLNDVSNTTLNTTNQTIIGALNELVAGAASTERVKQTYGNDTGLAISANRLVASDASGGGANDVAEASATSDGPDSRLLGVTEASIPDAGTGQVISYGRVPVAWVGGEAKPANSASVYLSTTAGLATSVPPVTAGNIILLIGYVTDNTGLSATTISGETALVSFFIDGPRLVV